MGISLIECGFGYVEDNTVGRILFGTQDGVEFETEYEALRDLAKGLYCKYKLDTGLGQTKRRRCCEQTLEKISDAEHCTKCGGSLKPVGMDFDDFADWIRGLMQETCDSFGTEITEACEEAGQEEFSVGGWTPWFGAKGLFERGPKVLLCLPQEADQFLIEVLSEDLDSEDVESWENRDGHIRGLGDEKRKLGLETLLSRKHDKYHNYHVKC
jgi:hypothetical protein